MALMFGSLGSAPPPYTPASGGAPAMFGQDQYLRPGSYFGTLNPNYQQVPNAFAPGLLNAPDPTIPMPLKDPSFLAAVASARAGLAQTRAQVQASRPEIIAKANQATLRSRQDTRYNVGQSEEDFGNRGVFDSGGRIQATQHIQAMGARNVQDIAQGEADALTALSQQLKQARLTAQQSVDQAALAASQQAAANPMPVQAYRPGSGMRVVAVAHNQIGDPYAWGSEGPNSFDCSGLYDYSLNQAGIHVPRTTAAGYYAMSQHIGKRQLRPGDAVYFSYGSGIDHMGIYAGNGFMIAAPHPGAYVSYMRVDWSHYVGGGRIGHS